VSTASVLCGFCGACIVRNVAPSIHSKINFCDIRCKAEYQKMAKPVSKDWLEKQYIELGRNTTQIAHEVGRDPKSVWNWLKDLGIPRRKRGTTGNHLFATPRSGYHLSDAHKQALRSARAKDGRIPALINGVHWMKVLGRKPASWKGGITPDRQALYASQGWKECVKSVWHRDNAICQLCHVDSRSVLKGVIKFELHHIDSFKVVERRADPSNVILLCQHCHKWIHSKKNKRRKFLGKGH
jgi:hypothetical protein